MPKGVAAAYDDAVANPSMLADLVAAYGLGEPLVLEGFGGSVVHKSDVGAVRMGVAAYEPVSEPDVLVQALDPILEVQPYPDVVIHTNVQAFYSYAGDGIERLFPIIETTAARGWPSSRMCLVLRNIDCAPPETAARIQQTCLDANLPTVTRFAEAMTAVATAKRHARNRALTG